MIELSTAFRRSLHVAALALCSTTFVVAATPASARSHHGAGRHARAYHAGHHARRHFAHRHYRHFAHRHTRHLARASRWQRSVAQMHSHGFADTHASLPSAAAASGGSATTAIPEGSGSSSLVAEARRYLGGNPTGRGSLWCARFANMVLEHTGHRGTGSDLASSFARYGTRVSGPQVGALAVMGRRGGGHVGIITGVDGHGNPIMISGNNRNRVREAPVSRGRIFAYVIPN